MCSEVGFGSRRTPCATNVVMRLSFVALFLSASSLLAAQSVTTRNGAVIYMNASGREQQITVGHHDRDPSISLDGQFVVFFRATKKTAPDALEGELWRAETSGRGQPAIIARSSGIQSDCRVTELSRPQFSPSSEWVYFLAPFAATSLALCRVDVSSHRASFLTGGAVQFVVLTEGGHRGEIIASMRTATKNFEDGLTYYLYPFYLLDAQGQKVRQIADASSDLGSLVHRYSSPSR